MNRTIPALLAAAGFSFLGLWGPPDPEYGDLSDALTRTMYQGTPPYHVTTDTAQVRADSGAPPAPIAPAADNPPAAVEQTPSAP